MIKLAAAVQTDRDEEVPPPDSALRDEAFDYLVRRFPRTQISEIEALAQDAYEGLLQRLRDGKEEEEEDRQAMVRTIAFRKACDSMKRSRSNVARALPTNPGDAAFGEIVDADSLVDPSERLDAAGSKARVDAVLATMSERRKAIFHCKLFHGMSHDQAAEAVKISGRTFRREWPKTLDAIQSALAPHTFTATQEKAIRLRLEEAPASAETAWAYELTEHDPATRILYFERLELLRREAGLVTFETELRVLAAGGLLATLGALLGALRSKLPGGDSGVSAASGGSAAGGGGGLLAAAGGSKVVGLCAGGAAVCAAGGFVAVDRLKDAGERDRPAKVAPDPRGPRAKAPVTDLIDRLEPPPSPDPAAAAATTPSGADEARGDGDGDENQKATATGDGGGGGSSAAPVVAAPEAAAEEFDPLASPVLEPAATPSPSSSSSGSSGGDSSTTAAGQEFGP